jgi:hypothetical protein
MTEVDQQVLNQLREDIIAEVSRSSGSSISMKTLWQNIGTIAAFLAIVITGYVNLNLTIHSLERDIVEINKMIEEQENENAEYNTLDDQRFQDSINKIEVIRNDLVNKSLATMRFRDNINREHIEQNKRSTNNIQRLSIIEKFKIDHTILHNDLEHIRNKINHTIEEIQKEIKRKHSTTNRYKSAPKFEESGYLNE